MASLIRIFRDNEVVGIEPIPDHSFPEDRLEALREYGKYDYYIIDNRIKVNYGYDENGNVDNSLFSFIK